MTMRVVLDNNQVAAICRLNSATRAAWRGLIFVLPPLVWAEIVLGPHGRARLAVICKLPIQFGADVPIALRAVAFGTDAQAAVYEPFIRRKSQLDRTMRQAPKKPTRLLQSIARETKDSNRRCMLRLDRAVRSASKRFRDAQSRGECPVPVNGLETIDDAMAALAAPGSFISYLLAPGDRSDAGKTETEAYTSRLKANPYTRRFWQFVITVHVGYANGWKESSLNVSPSENRDDLTDMTLALYARKGDIILTADRMFRRAYEHIDPGRTTRIMTCDEFRRAVQRPALPAD